jgi:hypothetical protein
LLEFGIQLFLIEVILTVDRHKIVS